VGNFVDYRHILAREQVTMGWALMAGVEEDLFLHLR
jgi:hypothetical protein